MDTTYAPIQVYFDVHGRLHRGWRDHSGTFTLEQDNLDAASAAGHLVEVSFADIETMTDRCQNCFPA